MQEKIKNWIENEYHDCIKHHSDPHAALTRSFGVLMFGLNELIPSCEFDELGKWWDDEMHPKFLKLFT